MAGERVSLLASHRTIMSGLQCETPSLIAYPIVAATFEWFTTVEDEQARAAMRTLSEAGIVSGETGAVSLAGAKPLFVDSQAERSPRPTRSVGASHDRAPVH